MGSAETRIERNPDVPQETQAPHLVPREIAGREGLAKPGGADKPSVVDDQGKLVFSRLPGYGQDTAAAGRHGPRQGEDSIGFDKAETESDKTAKAKDATVNPKDATDHDRQLDPGKSIDAYSSTLLRAGYSEQDAKELARKSYENFQKLEKQDIRDGNDQHLRSTPQEQMNRLNQAAQNILDKKGVQRDHNGLPTGKLGDGQTDHLTDADREGMVRDMANRYADQKENVVQGKHFSCSLQSMDKQLIQGGDPAALAEQVASLVNTGRAEVSQRDGKTRTVEVDSLSLKHDGESGRTFRRDFGKEDIRGMFGHATDALSGQMMADLKSERKGLPSSASGIDNAAYKYMAAHAVERDPEANTKTGEALLAKGADNKYHIVKERDENGVLHKVDSPGATLWDVAATNKAMGGADGAVFVHRKFAGSDTPPPGEGFDPTLRLTTYAGDAEFGQKLKAFEQRTGQSAQLMVDAPYLPGGGQAGHGLHVMNASMNEDGIHYDLDNNWSKGADIDKVGYDAIDRATNPDNWDDKNRPNVDTIIRPGDGRDPSESVTDFNERRRAETEAEKKQKEEEERKAKEKAKKREEEEELKKQAEREKEKKELALKEREQKENERLQNELDLAMGQWIYQRSIVGIDQLPPPPQARPPVHLVA